MTDAELVAAAAALADSLDRNPFGGSLHPLTIERIVDTLRALVAELEAMRPVVEAAEQSVEAAIMNEMPIPAPLIAAVDAYRATKETP